MDDKQFDEIMEKYVSSAPNNKANDLKYVKEYTPKHRMNFVLKWSSMAVCFCLIITLLIVLPSILNKKPQDSSVLYLDNEQIIPEPIYSVDNLSSYGLSKYLLPTITTSKQTAYIFRKTDDNEVVGIEFRFPLMNYDYETITVGSTFLQYDLQKFSYYSVCVNNAVWNNLNVKWVSTFDEINETYITKMTFVYDNYNYFIETETYEQLEPLIILDYIY